MQDAAAINEVRHVLQQFQNGYKARDFEKLDEFISLFVQSDAILPGANEINP